MAKLFSFIRKRDTILDKLPQLQMIAHMRTKDARKLPTHLDNGIEICCAIRGEYSWNIEGKPTTIRNNEISITLPWQCHSGYENIINKGELAFIIIQPKQINRSGQLTLGKWSRLPSNFQNSLGKMLVLLEKNNIGCIDGISECIDSIGAELSVQRECFVERIHAIIDDLLLRIGRHLNSPCSKEYGVTAGVRMVYNLIQKDLTHKWSMPEMESIAKCKSSTLISHFKKLTGMPPHQYIISKRIKLAKDRLRYSRHDHLTKIAHELEFGSSQHFSDVFKKWTGNTPSAYRKKFAKV